MTGRSCISGSLSVASKFQQVSALIRWLSIYIHQVEVVYVRNHLPLAQVDSDERDH